MSDKELEAKLALKVHPGARRNQVTGVTPDLVELKIAAPADKGKANAELVSFLAEVLDVAKSSITILRGDFSHNKLVSISGITIEATLARLGRVVAPGKKSAQGTLLPGE